MFQIKDEWRKLEAGQPANLEKVCNGNEGEESTFYRFQVPEGLFYALVSDTNGNLITLYSQKEMRAHKRSLRPRSKKTPKRPRKGALYS